jgi:hypothetical protein
MQTIEIPPEAWATTLRAFSTSHDGWLVSLDVMGLDIGAQPEINNLPLRDISVDRAELGGTIVISAARSTTEHVTHIIDAVTRVSMERTPEGADAALQIESADGLAAILKLRVAILPERVDGIPHR